VKKYSDDYFEKKYKILFDKLLQKEGFVDDIKATRKELGLPVNGFANGPELAFFFINKLTKDQQHSLTFFAFLRAYENEHKMRVSDENREEVIKAFMKEYKKGIGMVPMMVELGYTIETHHNLFTKYPFFEGNKYLSKLYKSVFKLMQKYWGVDLLDDHIIIHYIEKYLFMGQVGVNEYIRSKISCHNCRYLGVDHFSPNRNNMDGQDKGPYSKDYLFNKQTVEMLSQHFNSVFLIIKPYATKELVLQYIEDNWDDLKEHIIEKNTFYKQYDVHPSIIKESDDEKNRLVYELNKLSKKDLLKRYKGEKDFSHKGIYKEAIVSAILDEEYNIKMSSDAVKKSASRFAKSIQVQRIPKDIRDI
jgi:predicted transcriptional regulator